MSERLVMCNECRNKFPKSQLITPTKTTKFCKNCFEKREIRLKQQNELYDTIKELYGIPYVLPLFKKQIKDFQEQYGFTLKGIELTLRYCSLQSNIRFDSKTGMGIIPYKYAEAQEDYKKKQKLQQQMMNTPIINQKVKKIVVNIKCENKYLKNKLINLEEI